MPHFDPDAPQITAKELFDVIVEIRDGVDGEGGMINALTDAQLRATPVPVAFTGGDVTIDNAVVNVNSITDAQLRASPVPMIGTVSISDLPSVNISALPSGLATSAEQDTGNAALAAIGIVQGATTDVAVTTDVNGTISAKLRGIVKLLAAWTRGAGAVSAETQRVTLASDDPAVAGIGATTDAAVVADANGSLSAKIRGLVKIFADVWATATHSLTVSDLNSAALTSGGHGSKNVVTPATPVQLDANACKLLIITARTGNTKNIAYGFSNTVRATAGAEVGAILSSGVSVSLPVSDTSKIWIDATIAGEGVSYTFANT